MGSSLKLGLARLLEIDAYVDAVVVKLCDQPFVTSAGIDSLINIFRSSRSQIVAAEYSETQGVPALFSHDTFSVLAEIPDEKGARDLIRSGMFSVSSISMPKAALDIDTPSDLRDLRI